ncbi:MAG TPA: beta-glucanase, partial [Prevotella sp.]|nr:beta-glucanase [Prevotella sp.]
TFGGQSTYIFKVEGKKDLHVFMADIWRPKHPSDARYVWLPITYQADGTPQIVWKDEWSLKDHK